MKKGNVYWKWKNMKKCLFHERPLTQCKGQGQGLKVGHSPSVKVKAKVSWEATHPV